jgi:hypothetical protein
MTRYWPAGVKSKLPSGEKVRRLKNDEKCSSPAYILSFRRPSVLSVSGLKPSPDACRLGELADGMTAGSGNDGAGETDRLMDGDEPNEDRRLCEVGAGGFIGRARLWGVPGTEGTGDPTPCDSASATNEALPKSGGAGELEDIRLPGKSIRDTLLCRANCPSFVFNV